MYDVVQPPGSFESTLIHIGCKPCATPLPVLSQALEEHGFIFSQRTFLERGFFESVPDRSVELKKTRFRVILLDVSIGDFFV